MALEHRRSALSTRCWVRHGRVNHDHFPNGQRGPQNPEVHQRGNITTTNTRGNVRESGSTKHCTWKMYLADGRQHRARRSNVLTWKGNVITRRRCAAHMSHSGRSRVWFLRCPLCRLASCSVSWVRCFGARLSPSGKEFP